MRLSADGRIIYIPAYVQRSLARLRLPRSRCSSNARTFCRSCKHGGHRYVHLTLLMRANKTGCANLIAQPVLCERMLFEEFLSLQVIY